MYLLWNCPQMNVTGSYWWCVNFGSGYGLVPLGNKPLPEPLLADHNHFFNLCQARYIRFQSDRDIKNNAWVTVNNDFFVTSEAIRQWFSRVTKSRVKIIAESPHEWQKIVIHGNECIVLFLTRYFMSWTHKSAIIERSFRHCCQGRPFLTEHCDVTTIDLWRHANAKYWYCDVIFVYCHCTRKLAQRRSSLVNNSREYRYLATRYSWLSV